MKHVKSLGLVLLVGGLSGCLTVGLIEGTNPHAYPVLTDTIFAMGVFDDVSAQKLGVPHAVAFVGEKHTYLVTEGGEHLLQTAAQEKNFYINGYTSRLYIKDQAVWGHLSIGCCLLPVSGRLYPALALSEEQTRKLKQKHYVYFYNPPDTSPPPQRTLLLPATIAVDAVTLPAQALGIAVFPLHLSPGARGPLFSP